MVVNKVIIDASANLAAGIILIGLLCLLVKKFDMRGMRNRIFGSMLWIMLVEAAIGLVNAFVEHHGGDSFGTASFILNTVSELLYNVELFIWLQYVLYTMFKSKDYIKRHFKIYSIPLDIMLLAVVVNYFTKWLWYYDENTLYHETGFYTVYNVLRYSYLVVSVYFYVRFKKREKVNTFFNMWLYIIFLITGGLIENFTGFVVFPLAAALGFASIYINMLKEQRYTDNDSGFYNESYLSYLRERVEKKGYRLSSIISFEVKEEAQVEQFLDEIKVLVPDDGEAIRVGDNRVIMVSESADRGYVHMLIEDARMMAEDAGFEVEIHSKIKEKDVSPVEFFAVNFDYA